MVHAGIYYGTSSLKARLCVWGRRLLYEWCAGRGVPHRKVGKWILANDEAGREALEGGKRVADELGVPTRWVSKEEVERDGEGCRAAFGALESPETGIVDSHGLMTSLEGVFEEDGGVVAVDSEVVGVASLGSPKGSAGWEVTVRDSSGEESTIRSETVVNAAGLGSVAVHNMIVPPERHLALYFSKGNYFSYSASYPKPTRLLYPSMPPGHGGLGTHLTIDLMGRVRFGPDVQWVDDPNDLNVSVEQLPSAVEEIRRYLPGVDRDALAPDYAGIRPKLARQGAVGAGKGFVDFVVRKEEAFEGLVTLLGIESPGLTSSLAIGEMVEELLYGSGKT